VHPTTIPGRSARRKAFTLLALGVFLAGAAFGEASDSGAWCITTDPSATALERFAARELQRYVYVCTGDLLPVKVRQGAPSGPAFLVATQRRAGSGKTLAAQDYLLRSETVSGSQLVSIVGGDDVGTLYGVYRLAERLGVRFYLHGDVIPDERVPLAFSDFSEAGHALFSVRGLQPFHDFAEGPDWWNTDDYLCVMGQLAKLRMNFIGLHTYPDSTVGPEPSVWIGLPGQSDDHGQVSAAYPASYQTTGRSGKPWWTYAPLRTSDFVGGAAGLFDRDDFGSDVMRDQGYEQQTPAGSAIVFNRTAQMLGTAFAEAHRLGVLTCIGTETPLTLPAAVQDELRRRGRDPKDPAVAKEVYTAMFERIGRASPADYYWLWTPETWTWEGNGAGEFKATADDIQAALDALRDLRSPMRLATCGWVLGPQSDRSALDRFLPPESPMSAINAAVGYGPIDRQFANLSERPRWAIPWLENDGDLTADALRLGCTGLIGVHWRTRILAPAISALAAAAWDQSWAPADFDTSRIPPQTASGADGGYAIRATAQVSGTDQAGLYRTNRAGMRAYDLLVPNGAYRVRLGFSELQYSEAGRRVFSVKLQGALALDHLDLVAKYGPNRAVNDEFKDVNVANAHLRIEFTPHVGEPAIAVIEVLGVTKVGEASYARRIDCGGPAWGNYDADQLSGSPRPPEDRTMPVGAFYRDFAAANFGAGPSAAIGDIFAAIDGTNLPVPSHWIDGPGDIAVTAEPWSTVSAGYGFVGELEALRPLVRGSANLDRFDYWLSQFRAMRLIAEIGCTAGALDYEMDGILVTQDRPTASRRARDDALPLRVRLAELWTQLLRTEVAGASTSGELGTIANLEERSRTHQGILSRHDAELAKLLGCDLPQAASPSREYAGPARIIVPTVRTSVGPGESSKLRVLVAAADEPGPVVLYWRPLGGTGYTRELLRHVGRRVFEATLPELDSKSPSIEYHIEAQAGDDTVRWPASDRGLDQTVVLFDRS
jgi:hypothetical protein